MSIDFTYQMIFGAALLALIAVTASVFTRRIGAPILLIFLILGMLAGEDGPGGIFFDDVELGFLFGNIALAIIIFDGGLGTRRDTFRVSLKPALSLATLGVLLTAGITGVAVHYLLDFSWLESLLIGAIVGSTDAAAVFGLLRSAGFELKERTGATLEIESGSNDPMAIFLTITLIELIQLSGSDNQVAVIASEFARQMGLGLAIGYGAGFLLAELLKRLPLISSLYPLLALAGGMSVFGLTALWGGSGFLAIFIVGAMLGNQPLPYSNDIHRFHDGIAWLSQIGMFLMLGLLITPSELPPVIVPALLIAFTLIFVARPVAVVIALLPFHFPWREQVFIGWCGLRGAVPIILALFPSLAGLDHNKTYFELIFFVVLVSLILQGWTIAPVARWLGIDIPPSVRDADFLYLPIKDGQDKDLLVYPVVANSRIEGKSIASLPAAEGSQTIGVIRNGVFVPSAGATALLADDQVIIFGGDSAKPLFAKAFSSKDSAQQKNANFYGEFIIHPEATLGDIADAYGFSVEANHRDMRIDAYLNERFHGKCVPGDRVDLGPVQLIVRSVDQDAVIREVGLKIATHP